MTRSRKSKSEHNKKVKELANNYARKGYEVKADLEDWSSPKTIGGLRPDLTVSKGGHETVIEVETPDSKDSKRDLDQQKAFKQWRQGGPKRHYRRVITKK